MRCLNRKMALCLVIIMISIIIPIQQKGVYADSKININKVTATIWVKNYVNLKITGTSSKIIWKSGNKKIATVSDDGKVMGVQKGKVTITGTVNKKEYQCVITVKEDRDISCLKKLVQEIKDNNSRVDEKCKLIDEYYESIASYTYLDINRDGIKELLLATKDTAIICSVKDGKAVMSGKIDIDSNNGEVQIYYNKKYNTIVRLYEPRGYSTYYLNNKKLVENGSLYLNVLVGLGGNGGTFVEYNNGNKNISTKEFNFIHDKYYNKKDFAPIVFKNEIIITG